MPASKSKASATESRSVEQLLLNLQHPHKAGIERLRRMIPGTDKRICEEVKWNAPSFKIDAHFATFRIHPLKNIQLVLHTGAKARSDSRSFKIDDPDELLTWPASDRCVLTLASESELKAHAKAVQRILSQWVAQL
jgi:hypothetical protein